MSTGRIWLIAFLTAALLYGATADYGPQWQDSGWQQWRILTGEIDHPAGLVVTHPLQYWLGRLALQLPFGHPAGRTTLVSVLCGAIAIANLAAFGWLVTRRLSAAAIPAVALLFSHTIWQHATHTESYTLVAAVLTFEWICLALRCMGLSRWWLVAATAANGLGVANHLLAGLSTPILLAVWGWEIWGKGRASAATAGARISPATAGAEPGRYIQETGRYGQFALAAAAWVVCSLPYSALVLSRGLKSGDWSATLNSAVFGEFEQFVSNTRVTSRMLLLSAGFLIYNLPNLTVPLALHAIFRKTEAPATLVRILIVYLLVHGVFAFRYSITDQYTFLFPTYFTLGALASIGLADIQRVFRARATDTAAPSSESMQTGRAENPSPKRERVGVFHESRPSAQTSARSRLGLGLFQSTFGRLVTIAALLTALWPPLVYEIAYRVLSSRNALGTMIATKPYRDGYAAMLLPWGDRGDPVETTNSAAFDLAGPDGVILVGDEMFEHALRIHQRLHPEFERVHFEFLNQVRAALSWDVFRWRLADCLTKGKPVILVPRDRNKPTLEPLKARWTRSGDLYKLDSLEE